MANKENLRPFTPASHNDQHTPPGTASGAKPLRPWFLPAFSSPVLRSRSPNDDATPRPAVGRPDTPLKVRKTRENLRDARSYPRAATPSSTVTKENSQEDPSTQRQQSVSRRVLSRVRQSIGNRTRSTYSVRPTDSEASLFRLVSGRRQHCDEIDDMRPDSFLPRSPSSSMDCISEVGESCSKPSPPRIPRRSTSHQVLPTPSPDSSSSPEPTPRPRTSAREECFVSSHPASVIRAVVPHIILTVDVEYPAIDAGLQTDVWVAIEAAVHAKTTSVMASSLPDSGAGGTALATPDYSCGTISSLRLCYRPADGCEVVDVVGQKAFKDLRPQQKCNLYVKLRVPPLSKTPHPTHDQPYDILSELESIVGIFETNVLALEARYRHTLLPYDSIVTVRQTVKTRRPKTDLHWSAISDVEQVQIPAAVHEKLATYIEAHYEPSKALKLIDRCLTPSQLDEAGVRLVRQRLEAGLHRSDSALSGIRPASEQPTVDATQVDLDFTICSVMDGFPPPPPYSSPTEPLSPTFPAVPPRSTSRNLLPSATLVPPRTSSSSAYLPVPADAGQDEARKLWGHIRRSSLTTTQLAHLAGSSDLSAVAEIEGEDESVKALRRQALTNKRSVGVETLRAWKWDARTSQS